MPHSTLAVTRTAGRALLLLMSSSTFTLSTSQLLAQHSSTPQNLRELEGQVAPEIWPASQPDSGWLDNHFSSFSFTLPSSSHFTSCSHGLREPARQGEITADPSLWMDQCLVRPLEGQFDCGDLIVRPADGPVVSSRAGAGREAGVAGGNVTP